MTLGMIWTIILRFAIQDISVEGEGAAAPRAQPAPRGRWLSGRVPPQRPRPRRACCCGARGRRLPTRTSTSRTSTSG